MSCGVPELTGDLFQYGVELWNTQFSNKATGVFSYTTSSSNISHHTGASEAIPWVHFTASDSNNIYGNSDVVTPESMSCLICIKYE